VKWPDIDQLPDPPKEVGSRPALWVAIDGVTDPQNLGNILRSCHFFGTDGVIVGKQKSPPLGGIVSKASSGALEIMNLYIAPHFPILLKQNALKGSETKPIKITEDALLQSPPSSNTPWQIIGLSSPDAVAEKPSELFPLPNASEGSAEDAPKSKKSRPQEVIDFSKVVLDRPTILVVGAEGDGLRPIVKRYCHFLATISPTSEPQTSGATSSISKIGSLNVGSAVSAALFHLLSRKGQSSSSDSSSSDSSSSDSGSQNQEKEKQDQEKEKQDQEKEKQDQEKEVR